MINPPVMLTKQHVYEKRIQFFGEKKKRSRGGGEETIEKTLDQIL